MNFPGICLECWSFQGGTGNCLLIEAPVFCVELVMFLFPHHVGEWDSAHAWNCRQIIHKCGFPLRPLALIFELAGVSCLADCVGLILFDLTNVGSIRRDVKCNPDVGGIIDAVERWLLADPSKILYPMDETNEVSDTTNTEYGPPISDGATAIRLG